jgi:hypothetical protein
LCQYINLNHLVLSRLELDTFITMVTTRTFDTVVLT